MQKTLSELSTNSAQTGKNLTTQLDAIKHEITGVLKAPSSNAFNASELEKLVPLLPKLVEESRAVACRAAILSSLYFPGIKERYGQITKTDDSFQWIFRSSTPDQSTPRVYFLDWLRSRRANDHIFWIGGKPGSGKSTLMKFLYDNAHTKEVLQEWAHPKKLFIGAFYFWISGGPKMLQSQIGLLRSLLYEIFRQNPDIVQFACPDKFNQGLSPLPLGTIDWTLDELLNAFKTATTNAQSDARFCFFIDGSDECEGYPEAIVDLIRDQFPKSSDIKLCLASRKWNVFIDEYGDKECRRSIPRHLYLEELTWNDIRNFVQQEFETLERFRKREKEDPASCKKLIDDIVLKAEGVFLWVCLVVKSLKRGIKNRDSVQTLQKRLAQIPGELPEYFGNMLNNVEDIYHADAAKIYQIMLKARHPYLFMFSYLWERNPQFGMAMDIAPQLLQNTRKLKEDLCVQLNSRCTDLLDIVKISGYQPDIMGEYKVVFCHRTVRDYMRGQNAQKTLNEWLSSSNMDTSFEPNV